MPDPILGTSRPIPRPQGVCRLPAARPRAVTGGLRRRLSGLAVLAVLAVGCAEGPSDAAGPMADEILWDRWGVPHIYAADETTLFFGMGWAQMENHGERILRLYGESRGRAAEYWGEGYRSELGVPALDSDRFIRTLGLPDRGAAAWAAQSPEARERVQAFVDGVNAWAEDNRDRLDDAVEVVLPVTGVDVLTHSERAIGLFLTRGAPQQAQRILARGAEGRTAAVPVAPEVQWGSNAWAVGPSRSASGNALLMGNPHVPWFDITTWHEHHLVAPGVDAYGATFVGTPGISVGFNQRLGWSATVNRHDGADLYVLELDGDGYRFGDETRPFELRVDTLRVRRADDSVDDVPLPIRSSVHGPVLAADAERAVALRLAGVERPGRTEQFWEMARAGTLGEFEAAMRRLRVPMFNYLYADADGHTLYLFNATVPRRARGDVAFWAGAIDGTDPALLWTEYHAYDELPRVLDPATGWLQNANDPPWTATLPSPLRRSAFPPYLSPPGMGARAQRSAHLLRADTSITFDELVAYKHDTRVEMADRVLEELLPLAEASADSLVRAAGRVLAGWDRRVDADSRGAMLFREFMRNWTSPGSIATGWVNAPEWREPWSAEAPAATPRGIADPGAAEAALARAARRVVERWQALDVAWGDAVRLRRGEIDLPASGASGDPMGVFRVAEFDPRVEEGPYSVVAGDSFYFVVEFTPDGPRAEGLLAYGNASWADSPHWGDQLELFARQELRPMWTRRADVEANTVRTTSLSEAR